MQWRRFTHIPVFAGGLGQAISSPNQPIAKLDTFRRNWATILPGHVGRGNEDVGGWLRGLGLGQYEEKFRDNKIDADVLHG